MNHVRRVATAALAVVAILAAGSYVMAEDGGNQFEERTYVLQRADGTTETFKYRVLSPTNIEAGKKYPVVLFLHGAGERGDDNNIQLKYLPASMATAERREKYPCFVVAPQCHTNARWVEVNWSDSKSTPMTTEPGEQMQSVIGILRTVLDTEPVDKNRVYLTGLSMGGYGSWDLAMRHPEWFAAVAPICGGGDESGATRLKNIPLWAFHGDADAAVPVERSRQMIKAIEAAGGSPKYTEYPGLGHHSWVPAYGDDSGLLDWMFKQTK